MMGRTLFAGLMMLLCATPFSVVAQNNAAVQQQETPAKAQDAASEQVEALHAALLEGLELADFEARFTHLQPVVARVFDIPGIARVSVGRRTWRKMDDGLKAQYIDTLQQLVAATYASRFTQNNGQGFVQDQVQDSRQGVVVSARVTRPTDEDVKLDYYVRDKGIYNVVANGVSDLSLRRAEYSSIVQREGVPALLEHMQARIADARKPSQGAGS